MHQGPTGRLKKLPRENTISPQQKKEGKICQRVEKSGSWDQPKRSRRQRIRKRNEAREWLALNRGSNLGKGLTNAVEERVDQKNDG